MPRPLSNSRSRGALEVSNRGSPSSMSTQKSYKTKALQVNTIPKDAGIPKEVIISRIENYITEYEQKLALIKAKYEKDRIESARIIKNLQEMNDRFGREINNKDREISQLKSNYSLLEDRIEEFEREKAHLNHEIDLYKENAYKNIDEIRKNMTPETDAEYQIRD